MDTIQYRSCLIPADPAFAEIIFLQTVCMSPSFPVPMHAHEGFELVYVLDGHGVIATETAEYVAIPGHFLLFPPGVQHDQHQDSPLTTCCLTLRIAPWPVISGCWADENGQLGIACQRLVQEIEEVRPGYLHLASGLLLEIIGLVTRHATETLQPRSINQSLVERALRQIARKQGVLTVADLSEHLCISQGYLRHVFHLQTGHPPIYHILSRRVAIAQEMLRTTTLSLAQVSDQIGFTDQAYFVRIFKRATGLTPSAYRRKFHL
jgi:AraC-like DNA-binding protein/uncharacterized RmlC-like cupin family protein